MEVGPSTFNTKFVCLVLTCDRPYYRARRETNGKVFDMIRRAGFEIVYLLGNSNAIRCTRERGREYYLRVPVEEVYDNLSAKMEAAYQFFAKSDCIGILKVDDDIIVKDTRCFDGIRELLIGCDYFGVGTGTFSPGSHWCNPARFKNPERIATPYYLEKAVTYFGGPFYYVSKRVICEIAVKHLIAPWEDLSVGLVVRDMLPPAKVSYLQWYASGIISWNQESEA